MSHHLTTINILYIQGPMLSSLGTIFTGTDMESLTFGLVSEGVSD